LSPAGGRLRRSDCASQGIKRQRRGRGFSFVDAAGTRVEDEETLERVRGLAIPPAWEEVWICPDPLGHIQATGYDEAGRKQYLYHERWQQRQAERKYELIREFARKLPRLRRAVTADLRRQGMPRERALACAIRLLDLGFFRVGSEVYGILSNKYLAEKARTKQYTCTVRIEGPDAWSYEECTTYDHAIGGTVAHTDVNRLRRVSE